MFVGCAMVAAWALSAEAGTLAGAVFDPAGMPVEGASVTVYDHGTAGVATAETGADGTWEVDGLADGRYRVVAVPPSDSPASEAWAPSAPERCAGEPYDVEGDAVTVADVTLLPGAELHGVLLLHDGTPAVGAVVGARPENGARPRTTTTAEDGSFVVRGLPPVGVTVQFDAAGVPMQYWDGVYDRGQAWVLTASLAQPTDLGEITLLRGGMLTGTVVGPEGPVTEGTVVLLVAGQRLFAPIGADGTWKSSRLPSGNVLVSADVLGHALTFWPDRDRPGDRVVVEPEQRIDAVDLVLPYESRVRGALAGAPWYVDGAIVALHNDDDSLVLGASVDVDGAFQYTRLPAGEYTLWIDGTHQDRLEGYLEAEDGEPTRIVVPPGGVVELGVLDMPPAGRIEGTVNDRETGNAVVGAYVVAEPIATDGEEFVAYTDEKGWYALQGLPEGSYEIRAGFDAPCDTDREWVTFWHPNTPNDLFATLVDVRPGEVVSWRARLPSDDDHDRMGDAWERRHGLDPTLDDAEDDPDDDGFDNLAEYLLGTDPTDATERRREAAQACGCASPVNPLPLAALLLPVVARRRARAG